MSMLLLSDTKRVRANLMTEVQRRAPVRVLILDGAAPDYENRGGSAAEVYTALGLRISVCDPLTEEMPDIDDFDVVHMSGGNPFRLLLGARKQGLKEKLASGRERLLVGVSAGAMVMGTDIRHASILQPDLGIKDATAFGFVPHLIMPHMDLRGKYGDVIRAHVERTSDNWLLLNEDSLISSDQGRIKDLKKTYETQSSFDFH